MTKLDLGTDVALRIGMLERATAENQRRLLELERTLSDLQDTSGPAALPPRELTITADSMSAFWAGFYYRQMDEVGRPYRWTGRGDFFEFRFAIDRNVPWKFRMEIYGNDYVPIRQLKGFMDYVEIPLDFEGENGSVSGVVPMRNFCRTVVATFYLPSHFVPREFDPASTDIRELGAVFYELKLFPINVPSRGAAESQRNSRK